MDSQIKETRLDDVRIFRCKGPVFLSTTMPFATVIAGEESQVIVDAEGRAIGWAKYLTKPSAVGVELWADVIIDHESEARLLAENGELGLRITVQVLEGVQAFVIHGPPTAAWVPSAHQFNLKPVDTDWQDLFRGA